MLKAEKLEAEGNYIEAAKLLTSIQDSSLRSQVRSDGWCMVVSADCQLLWGIQ
jgi:hypothetical protein